MQGAPTTPMQDPYISTVLRSLQFSNTAIDFERPSFFRSPKQRFANSDSVLVGLYRSAGSIFYGDGDLVSAAFRVQAL